jgi:ferredoxin
MRSDDGRRRLLEVDPVACDGIGLCAHLAANLVRLDSWGYPIVLDSTGSAANRRAARRAVAGCPRQAMLLARD